MKYVCLVVYPIQLKVKCMALPKSDADQGKLFEGFNLLKSSVRFEV